MTKDDDFSEAEVQSYMQLIEQIRREEGMATHGKNLMSNPIQQAHRITIGLTIAYNDGLARPDPNKVREKSLFMSKWPKEKLLKQAMSCSKKNRHENPEYWEALVIALLSVD